MGVAAGVALVVSAFVVALLVTRTVREVAQHKDLLDHPNERSAHVVPTPRLGGIGIAVAFLGTGALLLVLDGGAPGPAATVLLATAAISALGLIDDLRPLPARWRFAVQLAAAATVVLSRGPEAGAALHPFDGLLPYPLLVAGAVLWIVWATNLYNFMDGIDGLAGGQAVFASLGLAVAAAGLGQARVAWLLLLLAAAASGFLRYNLPKASIFMGDVGSTAIGFFLAAVPFAATARPVPALAVVLALALFVLDATATLLRRVARGERWFAPHRTHLYQRPLAHGVPHAAITYPAWAGMAALAALAAVYPEAGLGQCLASFAAALVLFAAAWMAVRSLERSSAARRAPGRR